MRKIFFVPVVFLALVSCATVTTTKTSSVGVISLPESQAVLNLEFGLKDLEILGDIDVTERFTDAGSRSDVDILKSKQLVVELVAITSGRSPFVIVKGSTGAFGTTTADQVSSAVLAKVLKLYPSIDYILFPKVQVETVDHGGLARGQEPDSVLVHLTGRAVRLKI